MEILGKEVRIRGGAVKIAYLDGEGYQFFDDPAQAVAAIRGHRGKRVDLFTFIQQLSGGGSRYDFPCELDNMAVLHISTFDNWIKKQIDFKVRNKVRKAEKLGVSVREIVFDEAMALGVWAIYNESPIRQGKRFWHYGKDVGAVQKMNSTFPARSIYIGAFLEEKLIGFVKMVSNEDGTQAGLMQIISMIQHRDKAPNNALIAQAVRSCAERGIANLWYANFSYGRKQSDSLADFKRHNGFQKVEIPRYYVPLTLMGRIALRAGLQRGITEWFPESIAVRYRKVRSLWYAKRYSRFQNA